MNNHAGVSPKTVVVGLTGGIAAGKSTVAKMFSEMGAACIDADQLGHECYTPHTVTYHELIQVFGPGIVTNEGTIDRKALGAIVFGSKEKVKTLTNIVWPAIRTLLHERIQAFKENGKRIIVVEAAVLYEAGWDRDVDQVWVVEVPVAVAKQRLMDRNKITADEAQQRIDAQMSNEERRRSATFVISNDQGIEATKHQASFIYQRTLQRLA